MPMKLELREGEKVVLNGAVFMVEPRGRGTSLLLLNRANVLRARDVMKEEEATSLEKRLYLALQVIYLFPQDCAEARTAFRDIAAHLDLARPSLAPVLQEVRELVAEDDVYVALRRWGRWLKSDPDQTDVTLATEGFASVAVPPPPAHVPARMDEPRPVAMGEGS